MNTTDRQLLEAFANKHEAEITKSNAQIAIWKEVRDAHQQKLNSVREMIKALEAKDRNEAVESTTKGAKK